MTSPLEKLEARVIRSNRTAEYLQSLRPQTPVNTPLLRELLKPHPNQDFVSKLCMGLSFGFRVGYQGGRFPRTATNLPSANQHPHIIEENLLDEVQLGRLAGPFESPPFENFQIHPLGLVPKKSSQTWRTIFHLSYPKGSSHSLNANIPIEDFTLQYIRVDDAIALILKHGPGCFMSSIEYEVTRSISKINFQNQFTKSIIVSKFLLSIFVINFCYQSLLSYFKTNFSSNNNSIVYFKILVQIIIPKSITRSIFFLNHYSNFFINL